MSDRPTRDPQWATTPTDYSEPSEGRRAEGFVAGTPALASEVNAQLNNLGEHAEWCKQGVRQPAQMIGAPSVTVNAAAKTLTRSAGSWLDDGFHDGMMITTSNFVNAGNNVTQVIDGEPTDTVLTLTSGAGLVNETDATVTVVAHLYVRQRLTVSQPSDFQQSLFVGSSLEVGGQVTFNDQLDVLASAAFQDATFAQAVVFEDTVDMQADADVAGTLTAGTLHVTGDDYHGDRTLTINARAGMGTSTTASVTTGGVALGTGNLYVEIPVRVGDRIKSVTVARLGNASADFDLHVYKTTAAGVQSDLSPSPLAVTNPAAAYADSTLTIDAGGYQVAAGETIEIGFLPNATGIAIGNIRVVYDRPPP